MEGESQDISNTISQLEAARKKIFSTIEKKMLFGRLSERVSTRYYGDVLGSDHGFFPVS